MPLVGRPTLLENAHIDLLYEYCFLDTTDVLRMAHRLKKRKS